MATNTRNIQSNKLRTILFDLYYRLKALPSLFRFWFLLIAWKYRIEKHQARLLKNREKLDYIWDLSERLKGQVYDQQQKKLKQFEKEFLLLEEDIKDVENYYTKQKELFEKYLAKVFDLRFSNKQN